MKLESGINEKCTEFNFLQHFKPVELLESLSVKLVDLVLVKINHFKKEYLFEAPNFLDGVHVFIKTNLLILSLVRFVSFSRFYTFVIWFSSRLAKTYSKEAPQALLGYQGSQSF